MINVEEKAKEVLGSQSLNLDADHPLNQDIQLDNHRYWHIRLLFRPEYREFVTNVLLYWNTSYIIPRNVSWRNDDFHLLDPKHAEDFEKAKQCLKVHDPDGASLDITKVYPKE